MNELLLLFFTKINLILSASAQAPTPGQQLYDAGSHSGLQQAQLEVVVGQIIYGLLGFLGTIFLVLIIYAGFTWMTAGGNEEKIQQAQKTIRNSTVGLLIVILSYAITAYVIQIISSSSGAN